MLEEIRKYIKKYTDNYYCMSVSGAVPIEMRDGPVNEDGWVLWKPIKSNVSDEELMEIEEQYGFKFPPYFALYLKAYYQLLDQVFSNKYDGQLVMMPCCPSDQPLTQLKELIEAWNPLVKSGYIPFAQWGDGWGPICLDMQNPTSEGNDFAVIWFDHEQIIPLAEEGCKQRENIVRFSQPLYRSFKEFFYDIYAQDD